MARASSPARRNLVVCCDGTANQFAQDRTNVLKLAFAARKDRDEQLLYYHAGVGTMAPRACSPNHTDGSRASPAWPSTTA